MTVTCTDCLKDFDIITYKSHKTCMTEDQRYGGSNYVQKELKGQKKQNEWIDKLQNLIASSRFSRDIENYLNRITSYDNIPLKKPKFINFIKSSITRDEKIAEKLWKIVEQALKPSIDQVQVNNKSNGQLRQNSEHINNGDKKGDTDSVKHDLKQQKTNASVEFNNDPDQNAADNKKRAMEDNDYESDNKKIKVIDDLNDTSSDCNKSVSQVIENLIERSKQTEKPINPTKLAKKVLKRQEDRKMKLKKFKKLIRRIGPYTVFSKDLQINEFYDEFIKHLNTRNCFVIDDETIIYKI